MYIDRLSFFVRYRAARHTYVRYCPENFPRRSKLFVFLRWFATTFTPPTTTAKFRLVRGPFRCPSKRAEMKIPFGGIFSLDRTDFVSKINDWHGHHDGTFSSSFDTPRFSSTPEEYVVLKMPSNVYWKLRIRISLWHTFSPSVRWRTDSPRTKTVDLSKRGCSSEFFVWNFNETNSSQDIAY